jgi:glycogen debranching enzyme
MAKASEELDRVSQRQVPPLPQLKQTDPSTYHALQMLDNDAVTPKTPADEGKEFFLSERSTDERPICVYELRLDPDGGPNKDRSVSAAGVTEPSQSN